MRSPAAFVVLHAEFVAGVQLLIYVGAVVVLLVFGIMLTRAPTDRSDDLDNGRTLLGVVVGLCTAGVLVAVLTNGIGDATIDLDTAEAVTANTPRRGPVQHLGAAVRGAVGAAARRSGRCDRGVEPRRAG